MKQKTMIFSFGAVFLAVTLLCSVIFRMLESSFLLETPTSTEVLQSPVIILDAGHGGEDGGATGTNGVLEKDLNLSMTRGLASLLRLAGYTVVETRTEDKLLYSEGTQKGHKKQGDLTGRLAFTAQYPNSVLISIHMNTFGEPYYSGLQVYYAATEGSRELASLLQANVKKQLQPQNRRAIQRGDGAIYLLKNAVGCAVLVECGFLSNPEECALLSEKDYRSKLCFSLFCGMMEYINSMTGDAS